MAQNSLDSWFSAIQKQNQKQDLNKKSTQKSKQQMHKEYHKDNAILDDIFKPRKAKAKENSEQSAGQTSLNLFSNHHAKTSSSATADDPFSADKPKYQTVYHIQRTLRNRLHKIPEFQTIYVTGGITTVHPYGYICFSGLDDAKHKKVSMNMIIPKNVYDRIPFKLDRGTQVDVIGRISVSRSTNVQIYAQQILPKGASETLIEFQNTKKYLSQHHCFDVEHHKAIPKFPKQIAVITSKRGAVIRDIIETTRKRDKSIQIVLFPANMSKPSSMVEQIQRADEQDFDTLIIGRGGGSKQDLQPFNDKALCLATYHCQTPIIAAVGHGIDHPLIDYVADDTEVTPTGAAEKASPDLKTYLDLMNQTFASMRSTMQSYVQDDEKQLTDLATNDVYQNPLHIFIQPLADELDTQNQQLTDNTKGYLLTKENQLQRLNSELQQHTPLQRVETLLGQFKLIDQKLNTNEKLYLEHLQQTLISQNKDLYNNFHQSLYVKLNSFNSTVQTFNQYNFKTALEQKQQILNSLKNELKTLSPKQTLKRGYLYASHGEKIINSKYKANKAKTFKLHFKDGNVNVKIIK